MPYLILILAFVIALYALSKFFVTASVPTIKTFFRICIGIIYTIILLFFAMTGRIIVSLGLLLLAAPFLIGYLRNQKTKNAPKNISERNDTDDENIN